MNDNDVICKKCAWNTNQKRKMFMCMIPGTRNENGVPLCIGSYRGKSANAEVLRCGYYTEKPYIKCVSARSECRYKIRSKDTNVKGYVGFLCGRDLIEFIWCTDALYEKEYNLCWGSGEFQKMVERTHSSRETGEYHNPRDYFIEKLIGVEPRPPCVVINPP